MHDRDHRAAARHGGAAGSPGGEPGGVRLPEEVLPMELGSERVVARAAEEQAIHQLPR